MKCGHQVAFTCVHNISDLVFDTNDIMLVLVHKTQILTLTNAKSQFCTRSLTVLLLNLNSTSVSPCYEGVICEFEVFYPRMLANIHVGAQVHLLDTQYRMHPEISRFPNSYFYHNQVADGENVRGPGR